MQSWFTAFRNNMAPSSFRAIHMPQGFDIHIFLMVAVFIVPYIAFIIILPGIRKKRLISFIAITYQLTIGCMLAVSIVLPYWNIGAVNVETFIKAHSTDVTPATLSVKVGLNVLNVSLNINTPLLHDYVSNNQFDLSSHKIMKLELYKAYKKGLSLPVIKILEYFSQHQEGFDWGYKYRRAGHYTNAFLCIAIGFWCLQAMIISGLLTIIANLTYGIVSPSNFAIPFRGENGALSLLIFRYGACFYISLICGLLQTTIGTGLLILQVLRVYVILTVMSSKTMDANVGPSCKHGGIRRQITIVRGRIDDDRIRCSTYISNQIRARNCAQLSVPKENKIESPILLVSQKEDSFLQSTISTDVSIQGKSKILNDDRNSPYESRSSLKTTPASSLGSIDNVIHRSISQIVLEHQSKSDDIKNDQFIVDDNRTCTTPQSL
ncbi:Moladietz [Strongyloides ratti]|uniref:Moladietz n=1 Tax=Strongyloides ratti TaxID=34506 RepID=A0A090LDK3_STRRB|nr:Moladietz [Strongyloides ratti]CEF67847.1 Moladietz [Strongyloides ratti]